ncbi:MAG: 1-deoxy-D-xylulose-5-phosphate reductoisomerase [Cycloclasticus sp. symbiont of Poecilosclerida sp. M]|nr:MAG: 1-deoxy-D-xylulose-5-phosphate reductoisomerase [Cycloclasticus sp. symbiont of Poecilosclerida sp. M]
MKLVSILGSTGSIGMSTLDVIRLNKDKYRVVALTAHSNVDKLVQQCIEFQPNFAVIGSSELAKELASRLKSSPDSATQVLFGVSSLEEVAQLSDVNMVVAAIVGAAGLLSTLAAAKSGKQILLANKEALVISGELLMNVARDSGADILPLDSEHNALFQCMPAGYQTGLPAKGVRKIMLTASGGPFLNFDASELKKVTPEQACRHPNWSMGKKISVDSATMMNKGLEVIEASYLFDFPADNIEVLIHPQSIIHSMVDYVDGSVLAQLGNPDMRTSIAHALAWPERIESGVAPLDLLKDNVLNFSAPSYERFPCLKLAFDALNTQGTAPAILNAANEVAIDLFLHRKIAFTDISSLVAKVLNKMNVVSAGSIEAVLSVDKEARAVAFELSEGV